MKNIMIAAIVAVLATPVFSANDDAKNEEYRETCMIYAKEDGIPANEMDEYINSCVADFQETAKNDKN
jgi:hypothetical protein